MSAPPARCPRCRWMPIPYGVFLCWPCHRWARAAEEQIVQPALPREELAGRRRLALR